jgi:CubicO group peptidase (beta-lactamase class C family)
MQACLLAAVLYVPALAAAQPAGLPAAKLEAIRQAVREHMEAKGIPGLSVAVGNDFRLVWTDGFGSADLEHSVSAKAATVYRLGSISKPITAVAAMQLVERGRLDLDTPIRKYVPSFPEKPWPITPRQLLSHTSGIRHYGSAAEIASTRHYLDLVEPLAIFSADPLLFEPGTRFSYTTYGYNLLGAAIEAASGAKFVDYIAQNVFAPAGMTSARPDDVYEIVPNRSRGYQMGLDGRVRNCGLADTSNKIPGGGMLATSEDLVRFAIAVQRGVLLKKETVERMFTPPRLADGSLGPYALGWNVVERNGRKWVAHSGSQQGVSTQLATVPAQGLSVAVMANLERADLNPLVFRIAEILLQ